MNRKEKRKNVLTFYFLGSFPLIQLLIMNCLVAWSKLYLHFSFLFFSNSSLMRISRFLLNPWKIWSKMSRQGCQGCHLPILAEMQQDQRIWSHGSTWALHRMEKLCHSKIIYDWVYVTGHVVSWLNISFTELKAQRSSMTEQVGMFLRKLKAFVVTQRSSMTG